MWIPRGWWPVTTAERISSLEISLAVPQKTGYSSLIYNSQKLERTQMPLNTGMDTENVVHFHNGVLISY